MYLWALNTWNNTRDILQIQLGQFLWYIFQVTKTIFLRDWYKPMSSQGLIVTKVQIYLTYYYLTVPYTILYHPNPNPNQVIASQCLLVSANITLSCISIRIRVRIQKNGWNSWNFCGKRPTKISRISSIFFVS